MLFLPAQTSEKWVGLRSLSEIDKSYIEKYFHFGLRTHFLHKTVTIRRTSGGKTLENSNKQCFWGVGKFWVEIRCHVFYLLGSCANYKKRLL